LIERPGGRLPGGRAPLGRFLGETRARHYSCVRRFKALHSSAYGLLSQRTRRNPRSPRPGVQVFTSSRLSCFGLSSITVPWTTLLLSVVLYIVVPVIAAQLWRRALVAGGGEPADPDIAAIATALARRAARHPCIAVRLSGCSWYQQRGPAMAE
jgi:hypothetical protein